MTTSYDCSDPAQRSDGLAHAQRAIAANQCVVVPTDTVYGIAADAFSPQAVATLLASKGRGRSMPPPVLIPRVQTMDGLAAEIHPDARKLAEAFWPGGLTLIFRAQPSLTWDLGDTLGTVALRVPDDRVVLDLLALTGPLAVSSANRTGAPAATTAADAFDQLAGSVQVYLEGGPRSATASTIIDATGDELRLVRAGSISLDQLQVVVPALKDPAEATDSPETAGPSDPAGPTGPDDAGTPHSPTPR
ncbi:L-threonylcarbamoyladenylate synthase [Arthrobacter sp. Sr33]|uniref:L-threonylcarbamoyladenylate synthase n=1 Tax=Arthrobacter sp. TB 23 TaxID=494419 RepID=UPI0002F0A960|nr:L-threonylcarbamoyladenylate synthase [Arthrobacter sp. TB 23]